MWVLIHLIIKWHPRLICYLVFLLSRLGYLFSGPPGTGKSSLAFALAGHFGLPVFTLNLSLPGLTD